MPSLPSGTSHRPRGTDTDQNCERYVPALLRSGLGLGARPPPSTWRQLRTRTHPCSSASEIFPVNRVFLSVPLQCGKSHNSNTDGFWSALRSAMSDLITQSRRVLRGTRQLLGAPTEPSQVVENPSGQNCRPQTARRQHTARRQSILDPQAIREPADSHRLRNLSSSSSS